ncbi:MAG: Fis family transcriptional regulator [Peptococcaceae bacterium BICA1-8]|nr:MAG: Fis family transcriptional regulator [Peptococcaceae bacterium BICA1-8]
MSVKNLPSVISEYFENILDVFNDGIYITDYTGKTLKVNKMYERQSGLNEEEIRGRFVQDLVKEGVFDNVLNPEIVKTGKPGTCVQVNKRGRRIVLNGYPVFDGNGNVTLVVTFARDITILSQLQNQIATQQELIDRYQYKFSYYEKNKTSAIIAESLATLNLLNLIKRVSKTDASVLILGETGVGKDVFARQVHKSSPRVNEPFFKVDCTSIPENLIESELFGYAPGAFSGANTKGKPGFFELADKGTLFLDEVGELPLSMQGKLLRVLQDQEVMSVGATKIKKVDVRIIAATNRDLWQEVKEGKFRSDLYYRLRVAVIDIPPLRERKDDIPPLAKFFLEKYTAKYKKITNLDNETQDVFLRYDWPGNIRELENLIQSLVVTRDKELIEVCDLPSNMLKDENCLNSNSILASAISKGRKLTEIMDEIEKDILEQAINEFGSVAAAAKYLQVDRSTIFRKLKKSPNSMNLSKD